MYTCIIGRKSPLTASWVARARSRDSAAAAATLGFMLKKEQDKVIVAFTQGHDDFVALPIGFGLLYTVVCRTFLTNFEASRTDLLLW